MADRAIEPGIVHHSDRGVQYCCQAYVERLQGCGFVVSMSRAGNDEVYNRKRLHSSLGYLSPNDFEQQHGSERPMGPKARAGAPPSVGR